MRNSGGNNNIQVKSIYAQGKNKNNFNSVGNGKNMNSTFNNKNFTINVGQNPINMADNRSPQNAAQ